MEQHFSVFGGKGSGDSKPELVAHYENWGWLSFLSTMAESKVFDMPGSGLDSIECVKNSNGYKVLIYASQKRDLSIAEAEAYKI